MIFHLSGSNDIYEQTWENSPIMGMTLTEKIMARAAGRATVRPGEIVYPEADLATIHDLYVVEADTQLRALGVERPWNPDRVFVCFDHDIIPQSVAVANRAKNIRDIVQRWGVKHFYGPGRGQGHGGRGGPHEETPLR